MRILMLAQFYPPMIGGEERHVRNLSVELARRGHELHVGTLQLPDGAPAEPHPADAGVTVHPLDSLGRRLPSLYADPNRPMAAPLPDLVLTRALARLAGTVRPDVVHAHNWIVNSFLPVKHRVAAPLVLSLHDYSHVCATKRLMFHGAPCAGPAVSRCLGCVRGHYGPAVGTATWASVRAGWRARQALVDAFTPVSRYVAAASGLIDDRGNLRPDTEVIGNFVPDELAATAGPAHPQQHGLPDGPYLFFAGDLSDQKGLGTLLRAYQLLPEGRPELLAVGRPTPDLPTRLPAGVRIEHEWPHERVLAGFAGALAAVLPSVWPDPCPTTVLEALSMGTPVITTASGGIADQVQDGRSALVVPAGQPEPLARAMTRLIEDAGLRRRLVAGGRLALAPYLCSSVADRFEALYGRVASGLPPVADAGSAVGTHD